MKGQEPLVFEIRYEAVRDQEQIEMEFIITGIHSGKKIKEIKRHIIVVTKLNTVDLNSVDFTDNLSESFLEDEVEFHENYLPLHIPNEIAKINPEFTDGYLDYGDPYGKLSIKLDSRATGQFEKLNQMEFQLVPDNERIKVESIHQDFDNVSADVVCLLIATQPGVYNKNTFTLTLTAYYKNFKYKWSFTFSTGRERYGGLEINTTQEDLKTYLNDQLVGEGNLTLNDVGACLANKLYFTRPGGEPQELLIPVKDGKTTVVHVELCEELAKIVPLKTLDDYDIDYKSESDYYSQYSPSNVQLRKEVKDGKAIGWILLIAGSTMTTYYFVTHEEGDSGALGGIGILTMVGSLVPFAQKEKPNYKNINYNNQLKSEARKKARDAAAAENARLTDEYRDLVIKQNANIEALNARRRAFNSKEKEKIVFEYAIR